MKKINNQEAYNELSFYTFSHARNDPSFIHQYIVDAYAAQNADENTKPITLAFALLGLYLYLEKGYSGREVQLAHMKMAKNKKEWPKFNLPIRRGEITVYDVLLASGGPERDAMIKQWCLSVWQAYDEVHKQVADLAGKEQV
ncbi:MAG TPA: DUF5946 family protein [Candidatus Paceibacterota bacterium]|jgi:hypothetical protein|nr:DUF5946 family protein [Candidatus Paceibacterota bacterium]